MTLNITTLSMTIFSITKLIIMALSIMRWSKTIFSIMTYRISLLGIMILIITTLSKRALRMTSCGSQPKDTQNSRQNLENSAERLFM